jgi:hypothetical protein
MTTSTLLYNSENQATKVHLLDTGYWDMFLCKIYTVYNKMSFTIQLLETNYKRSHKCKNKAQPTIIKPTPKLAITCV